MDRDGATPPKARYKDMLKPKELPQWAKEPILARWPVATWLAKRPMQHPDFEDKSLQKVDGLVEIPYISNENADENPKVKESVKNELPTRKKNERGYVGKEETDFVGEGEVVCTKYDQWWVYEG